MDELQHLSRGSFLKIRPFGYDTILSFHNAEIWVNSSSLYRLTRWCNDLAYKSPIRNFV